MHAALDREYVSVEEAAELLRVHPSTIRRWIARGDLPAYRIGRRRVALKIEDVGGMIAPARSRSAEPRAGEQTNASMRRRLTPEEQRRGLEALERVERLEAEILAERGGQPFSPPSWELLNESRDERSRQLDDLR